MTLQACDRCGEALLLLAHTVKGWLCAACWRRLGYPTSRPVDPEERERRKNETVRRMLALGGDTAHLVRTGKAGL